MKKLFAGRFSIDFSGRLVMLAVIIYLTRSLGVELWGQLAFGLAVVNIAYFFCEFGAHQIFLKEMGETNLLLSSVQPLPADDIFDEKGHVIWIEFLGLKLVLSLIVMLVLSALSPWIWPWEKPLILIVLGFFMIGNSLIDISHQVCNAAHKLNVSMIIMVLHRLFIIAGVVSAVLLSNTLGAIALGLGLGSFIGALLGLITTLKMLHLPLKVTWIPKIWFSWLKKSFPLALASFLSSTYLRLGLIMLPWFYLEKEVGLYAAAHKIFETGYMIPAALMAVALPKLSNSYKQSNEAFRREVKKVFKLVMLIFVGWIVVGEALSYPIIRIAFGEPYVPAVPVFRIFIIVNTLVLVNVFLSYLMLIFDLLPKHARNMGITTIICVIASFPLIKHIGPTGAALALIITELGFMTITLITLRPSLKKTYYVASN